MHHVRARLFARYPAKVEDSAERGPCRNAEPPNPFGQGVEACGRKLIKLHVVSRRGQFPIFPSQRRAPPVAMDESTPIEIHVAEVKQLMDGDAEMFLLDCREPHEYQWCHLNGAQLIPLGQIPDRTGSLGDPQGRIVVYCHHGIRSLRVAHWLRQQGFSRAQSMAGGIEQWSCEIDPAVPRY